MKTAFAHLCVTPLPETKSFPTLKGHKTADLPSGVYFPRQALAGLQLAGRSFGGSDALLVLRFLAMPLRKLDSTLGTVQLPGMREVASVE